MPLPLDPNQTFDVTLVSDKDKGEVFRLVNFADKGLMPLGGGVLEQTQWFLSACEMVWSERFATERAQAQVLESQLRS